MYDKNEYIAITPNEMSKGTLSVESTMPKYAEVELVKRELDGIGNVHGGIIAAIKSIIDDIPAADVEEVRHGKWIKDATKRRGDGEIYDYCCSECQGEAYEGSYGNNDVFSAYCHHCGAKMDGKEKTDEKT